MLDKLKSQLISTHKVWRLHYRPIGHVADTDLELCVQEKPVAYAGKLFAKNLFVSIDPTQRIWRSDRAQYMFRVECGDCK